MSDINEYLTLAAAFDHLNAALFGNALPKAVLTLQRHPRARGYYRHRAFRSRTDRGMITAEIALNPDAFAAESDAEVLSTLAHEMAHLWQAHFGRPSRSGYHNEQWARKMLAIGLQPISIDRPGKLTGQRLTHEIIAGGPFDCAVRSFLAGGRRLEWEACPPGDAQQAKKKNASKTRYACPHCDTLAWARPGAYLLCGDCELPLLADDLDPGVEDELPIEVEDAETEPEEL